MVDLGGPPHWAYPAVELQVRFETPFKSRYQRNNKQTGRKNLRCFPCCHPVRHMSTGFCGQPVKCTISNCSVPPARLRCWAVFETENDPPAVELGHEVEESAAIKMERCRQFPMLPWLRGNVYSGLVDFDTNGFEIMSRHGRTGSHEGQVTVVINSERMGWHYAWMSNKHTCDVRHNLRLYVFEVRDGNQMVCLGSFASPAFQIYCRRRDRKPKAEVIKAEVQAVEAPGPAGAAVLGVKRAAPSELQSGDGGAGGSGGGQGRQVKRRTSRVGPARAHHQMAAERRNSDASVALPQHTLLRLMEFICFKDVDGHASKRAEAQLNGSSSALEDFSSNLLGNIVYGLDLEAPSQAGGGPAVAAAEAEAMRKPDSIGLQLAAYLCEENSFTAAISEFFLENAIANQDESSLGELFNRFLNIVQQHVEGFLKERGIDRATFMRQLDEESRAVPTIGEFKLDMSGVDPKKRFNSFKIAFLRRLRSETRPAAFPASSLAVSPDFDINGTWLNSGQRTQDFEDAQQQLASRGYPVFVFKVIRMMLWRFRVTMSGEYCALQGEKKLMHSGEFIFKLDGQDHPFEIPHVVPLGMASIPCMYRASCIYEEGIPVFRCVVHGYFPRLRGVRFEILRDIYITDNRQILDMTAAFDLVRATGKRERLTSFSQRFFRTSSDEDYAELLDFTNDLLANLT